VSYPGRDPTRKNRWTSTAFAEAIPFPIESEDKGCRLHAERLSEEADAWSIVGEGFKPGDYIRFVAKGPGGSQKGKAKLTDKGSLELIS